MYEVSDRSLYDIQYVLNPNYSEEDVEKTGASPSWSRALDGSEYMPGLVGLNDMKMNDYANVVFQTINRIAPLRNFLLRPENYVECQSVLVQRCGELMRKMWNSRAFKGHVSPHEIMQTVMSVSNKRYLIDKQSDPVEFFSWMINTLHEGLTNGKRRRPSPVTTSLQGEVEVTTLAGTGKAKDSTTDKVDKVPFLMLALDLPPAPLYKDALERVTIPQVPLFDLLKKYDGTSVHDDIRAGRRRLRLTKLPKYLVLHIKRFTSNQFFTEKNPTIVNFPVKGLHLAECVPVPGETKDNTSNNAEKDVSVGAVYDLVANIVHEGKAGAGSYKVHVYRAAEGVWYEVQDLSVIEVLPQVVALSEAYMQVYQLRE
jgi:U4/U6.U5 tri-snRNP-associated protein 2